MTLHDDDERRLASALGGPAPEPRRHDAAFAKAVLAGVKERRAGRSSWALPAWAGVGGAAALALFMALSSSTPVEEPLDDAASLALFDEEAFDDYASFDDEELEALEDEELLALIAALDEALAL